MIASGAMPLMKPMTKAEINKARMTFTLITHKPSMIITPIVTGFVIISSTVTFSSHIFYF